MAKAVFAGELIQGHGGVTVVLVPFDPEEVWKKKPIAIDPRRYGWLVRGTINDVKFDGWIGHRWGRYFIMVDDALRASAGASVGEQLNVVIEPTDSVKAFEVAKKQAARTTAPKKRTRAVAEPPTVKKPRSRK